MNDHEYDTTARVPVTNKLSEATFDATVRTLGNTRLRPPKVASITIDSWDDGRGYGGGRTIVHFDPATLSGGDEEFAFDVMCTLRDSADPNSGRRSTAGVTLTELSDLNQDFEIKSEAPASGYAKVDGLNIEITMHLTETY